MQSPPDISPCGIAPESRKEPKTEALLEAPKRGRNSHFISVPLGIGFKRNGSGPSLFQKSLSKVHKRTQDDLFLLKKERNPKLKRKIGPLPLISRDGELSRAKYIHLYQEEYRDLAQFLQQHNSSLFRQIKEIPSPLLMEQITDLYRLFPTHARQPEELNKEKILQFCLKIAQEACEAGRGSFFSKEKFDDTNLLIGKVMHLVNSDPAHTVSLLDLNNLSKSREAISAEFEVAMQQVDKRILDHEQSHSAYPFQNPHKAKETFFPVEFSKIIVTNSGRINVGILNFLCERYLTKDQTDHSFEIHLKFMLNLLRASPKLRSLVFQMQKPDSTSSAADVLIRVSLELSPTAVITDNDARRTGLAALLSLLRQAESVGNCFATSIAIQMLSSHPMRCLKDFSELLQTGRLTRQWGYSKMTLPCFLHINSDQIDQPLSINEKGTLILKKAAFPLWKLPGLQAACRAIGISDIETAFNKAYPLLSKENAQKLLKVSLRSLLSALIEANIQSPEPKEDLLNRAILAFETEQQNLLLRMWESAIAGISEAREDSSMKTGIAKAILDQVQKQIKETSPDLAAKAESLLYLTQQILLRRIQPQFDPSIVLYQGAKKEVGCFILYDRGQGQPPQQWKPILTAEAFQQLVIDVFKEAYRQWSTPEKIAWQKPFFEKLEAYLISFGCLLNIIISYDSRNLTDPAFGRDINQLAHSPWRNHTGNFQENTLINYTGDLSLSGRRVTLIPDDAESLLTKLVQVGKRSSEYVKSKLKENPLLPLPIVHTGHHAYSLLLGHPTLLAAWESTLTPKEWIEKYLLKPGQVIANSLATQDTRVKLIQFVASNLITKAGQLEFFKQVQMVHKDSPVRDFRNNLVTLIQRLPAASVTNRDYVARNVDTFLCEQALPEAQRALLHETAVHFADTNWTFGEHNIHYGFQVNPGTGQLDVWKIADDSSKMEAIPQPKYEKQDSWKYIPGSPLGDALLDQ